MKPKILWVNSFVPNQIEQLWSFCKYLSNKHNFNCSSRVPGRCIVCGSFCFSSRNFLLYFSQLLLWLYKCKKLFFRKSITYHEYLLRATEKRSFGSIFFFDGETTKKLPLYALCKKANILLFHVWLEII